MKKRYLPKFRLTGDESLSNSEIFHITRGLSRYLDQRFIMKAIPVCLLIALIIVALSIR